MTKWFGFSLTYLLILSMGCQATEKKNVSQQEKTPQPPQENHKLPEGFASQYIPLTFAKVVGDHKLRKGLAGTKIKANHKMVFDTDIHPLAISVVYAGNSRKLGGDRLDFERHFNEAIEKSNDDFFSRYHKEIEVLENGKSYWVAVDDKTLSTINSEMKRNDQLIIYVRYLGQIGNEPICFMIDFSAEKTKE